MSAAFKLKQIMLNSIVDEEEIENLVCEKFNCNECTISEDGDIWISGPMTGHWISDELIEEFIQFLYSK